MTRSTSLGDISASTRSRVVTVDDVPTPPTRAIWEGNWNVYWLLNSILGLWFIFIYTPMNPPHFDVLFTVHLLFASFVYIACMWNTFHTPSHGAWYRSVHRWLGRLVVLFGVIGFVFGLIVAWPEKRAPIGLAIGLTIGGTAQMLTTVGGAYFIYKAKRASSEEERKRMIEYHALCMIGLFVGACGTPAVMRLAGAVGLPFTIGLPLFSILLLFGIVPMKRAIYAKRFW